jgi:diketogulonate reductase-like aldo/keto reductase
MSRQVSVANVGVRWVLDQPAVGGAIVGCRFGLKGKSHIDDTRRVFEFELTEEDKERIRAVTRRSRDLLQVIGDCGDEYRG